MTSKLTLAVDFDGVIHKYSKGFMDGTIYDDPMDGALESLLLLHKKYNIVIFTTRLNPEFRDPTTQNEYMEEWLNKNNFVKGIHYDEMTGCKPKAHIYLDDRGMKFENWKDALMVL